MCVSMLIVFVWICKTEKPYCAQVPDYIRKDGLFRKNVCKIF